MLTLSAQQERVNDVLRLARRRIAKYRVGQGWVRWRNAASELTASRAQMRRTVRHLFQRKLARGYHTWVSWWTARSGGMGLLTHAVGHLRNRGVSLVWRTWSDWAQKRARSGRLLRKGVGFVLHSHLAQGWCAWRYHAVVVRQTRAALDLVSSSVARLRHLAKWRGLAKWRAVYSARMQAFDTLRRGIGHVLNRQLSRGWHSWAARAAGRIATKVRLLRCIGHLLHRKIAKSLHTWREHAGSTSTSIAQRALRYFKHRGLALGFVSWAAMAAASADRRWLLTHAVGHLRNRGVSIVWRTWSDRAHERSRARQLLCKAVGRIAQSRLALGFNSWVGCGTDAERVRGALTHFMHRGVSRGWHSWRAFAVARARMCRVLRHGVSRMVHRNVSRGWHTWAGVAATRASRARLFKRVVGRLMHRQLARALHGWVRAAAPPEAMPSPSSPMDARARSRMEELQAECDMRGFERDALAREVDALRHAASAAMAKAAAAKAAEAAAEKMDERRTPQLSEDSVIPHNLRPAEFAPAAPTRVSSASELQLLPSSASEQMQLSAHEEMWQQLLATQREAFEERLRDARRYADERLAAMAAAADENRDLRSEIARLRASPRTPVSVQTDAVWEGSLAEAPSPASSRPRSSPGTADAATSTCETHDAATSPIPSRPGSAQSNKPPLLRTDSRRGPTATTYDGPKRVEERIMARRGSFNKLPGLQTGEVDLAKMHPALLRKAATSSSGLNSAGGARERRPFPNPRRHSMAGLMGMGATDSSSWHASLAAHEVPQESPY